LPRRLFYRAGIAASVLLVCIAGWLIYSSYFKAEDSGLPMVQIGEGWVERENLTRLPERFTLADGSTVTLEPGSRLRHPASFTGYSRQVQLTGKAFFDVQKQPARPFLVYTGPVVTKVLGTSFRVNAIEGQPEVQVEVVTGRVSVYEQSPDQPGAEANGVVLSPNHKATYFTKTKLFTTGLVSTPVLVDSTLEGGNSRQVFVYDDAPIAQVVADLETAYSITIMLENDELKKCLLTATLTGKPLYTQLDIICAALGTSYVVQGTTILINGKGCA
jgi:ferric-dicitrate binding protein FerR (iron transport regulator)